MRFAQWLRKNSNLLAKGIEHMERDPIKLRHRLTGRSGVTHEVDIYAYAESRFEGRVIKETIHPGALFLVSCKATRAKLDKSHIAEWISIVRDILLNVENQVVPGVEMIVVVSRQGFTSDAVRFARANPILTYIYNEKNDAYNVDVRAPLLLFEQRGPTDFVQVSPAEEDIHFFEGYGVNLYQPYEFKFPKDWTFEWLLPDTD